MSRFQYLQRVISAYCLPGRSQLTFWHESPEAHPEYTPSALGPYYMTFSSKADYPGPFDPDGIPQLDYHGSIGLQYNPIAIAQYGLGNYNLYRGGSEPERRRKFLTAADWLVKNLEENSAGMPVWMHRFDFEYRTLLRAPWYSGLAQGQGISLLVRAHQETSEDKYLDAAKRAFMPMTRSVNQGGVLFLDEHSRTWIEEYVVFPPTHILNGFIWGLWGVHDLFLVTRDPEAKRLWDESVKTLKESIGSYDAGFWSLYEHSGTRLRMIASRFYHSLHIVQLRILHALTNEQIFADTAARWERYRASPWRRFRAQIQKICFKLLYY